MWPPVSQGGDEFFDAHTFARELAVKLLGAAAAAASSGGGGGGTCPDLAAMRSERVRNTFDGARVQGVWYEHAYIDVAQVGASCQTLDAHFNASTHALSMDFRVTYGPVPFTIVEDYAANGTVRGLFVKRAEMPGAGLLTLPTVVVDAALPPDGGTRYDSITLFSCTTKLGLLVTELVMATRAPTIEPAQLAAMKQEARLLGVPFQSSDLQLVNHTGCTPPPQLQTGETGAAMPATSDSDTVIRPPPGVVGQPVGMVLIQGAQIPTARYRPLAEALIAAVPFPLSIAIPAFVADLPEPVQISSCVGRAIKALALPAGAPIFAAGHSLGAVMIQDYVFRACRGPGPCMFPGLVLMGGALQRKYRNGTDSHSYPVPHLVLDGNNRPPAPLCMAEPNKRLTGPVPLLYTA